MNLCASKKSHVPLHVSQDYAHRLGLKIHWRRDTNIKLNVVGGQHMAPVSSIVHPPYNDDMLQSLLPHVQREKKKKRMNKDKPISC